MTDYCKEINLYFAATNYICKLFAKTDQALTKH